MLTDTDTRLLKSTINENNNYQLEFNTLREKLIKTSLVGSKLDGSSSSDEIRIKSFFQVTAIRITLNFISSSIFTIQTIGAFKGTGFFTIFPFISIIIALIYLFFVKPADGDILDNVKYNIENINTYYDLDREIKKNTILINNQIEGLVNIFYKNQPIIDVDLIKNSNLNFIPSSYIHNVLQQEVRKGLLEKIEVADVKKERGTKILYKSKVLSKNIKTNTIVLD